jgi:hypothetical protein
MLSNKTAVRTVRFLRSVNVEADYNEKDALDGYVVTAGARRALNRIALSRFDPAAPKAWTLTGPYGTGKSAFSVFALQLLSPTSSGSNSIARELLRRGDRDLFDELLNKGRETRGLWPIVITGSREPIQHAFLRGLKASLVNISRTRNVADILGRVSRILKAAINGAQTTDREILDLFRDAIAAICRGPHAPAGVFMVIDEMGKLLEYAATHPQQSDVYLLQHISEFASRSPKPFLLVGVLHQDFAGYASRLSATERAEWEKVRGRFEDVIYEEPADEILRLIAAARESRATREENKWSISPQFVAICEKSWKLHLAPTGIQKPEFLRLLSCAWPLHPLTSVLIGQVFKKLAQNERSAFSFLASSEPAGLTDFLQASLGSALTYGLHNLYDYLLNAFGDGLYLQRNGKRWAEIEGVLARLPDASPLAVTLLKTIGVLSVIGEWRKIVASREILDLAMIGLAEPSQVTVALGYLAKHSAIVTRRYSNSFALWQGSDIDIDERIREARGRLDPSRPLAEIASGFVSPRPIVARRHSFSTGTLRYFSVEFVHPSRLTTAIQQSQSKADGKILVAIPNNAQELEAIRRHVVSEELAAFDDVLVVVPSDAKALDGVVRELACIEWVKANTPTLEGDAIARRELRARAAELLRQLETHLDHLLAPTSNNKEASHWYHRGKRLHLQTKRELNAYLSDTVDRLFPKTPVILNELLNRRDLSSAAAGGRRLLIEAMLERGAVDNLGIQGTPPEMSMYLSLLKKHTIHQKHQGEFRFGAPSEKADAQIRDLWSTIQEFFTSTERETKSVAELFAVLLKPPYGLREGPIPVIVCAALIASDSDVALYELGSFVPRLTISVFERLLKKPEDFLVRRWRVSGVRAAVFHQLSEMLGKTGTITTLGKHQVLDVVRPLLKFVSQLTDYAKNTERISARAAKIRTSLFQTREADQLLFVQLPLACGVPTFDSDGAGNVDVYLSELRLGITELRRCYDDLISELTLALGSAFRIPGNCRDIRNDLTERVDVIKDWGVDPVLKSFFSRVLDRDSTDNSWVEGVAALITERPPTAWRDADRAKFEVALSRVSRLFLHLEALTFSKTATTPGDGDPIRIGITRRTDPEQERVVHMSPTSAIEVRRIEKLIESALELGDTVSNRDIALAALARVVEKLIGNVQTPQIEPRNGHVKKV